MTGLDDLDSLSHTTPGAGGLTYDEMNERPEQITTHYQDTIEQNKIHQ